MYFPVPFLAMAAGGLRAALASPLRRDTGAIIDKPAVSPPFSEAAQAEDLYNDLPSVDWQYEAWDPD